MRGNSPIQTIVIIAKYDSEDRFWSDGWMDFVPYDLQRGTKEEAIAKVYPAFDIERNFLVLGALDGNFSKEHLAKIRHEISNHPNASALLERLRMLEFNARRKPPQTYDEELKLLKYADDWTLQLMILIAILLRKLIKGIIDNCYPDATGAEEPDLMNLKAPDEPKIKPYKLALPPAGSKPLPIYYDPPEEDGPDEAEEESMRPGM